MHDSWRPLRRRLPLVPATALTALLASRLMILSAAVVITVHPPPPTDAVPMSVRVCSRPGRPAAVNEACSRPTLPEGFELGQIAAIPEDLRHRATESNRPVVLALLAAAVLPLGLLAHSWWVGAQIAARRD